jgi:hypothetical protein
MAQPLPEIKQPPSGKNKVVDWVDDVVRYYADTQAERPNMARDYFG